MSEVQKVKYQFKVVEGDIEDLVIEEEELGHTLESMKTITVLDMVEVMVPVAMKDPEECMVKVTDMIRDTVEDITIKLMLNMDEL